MRGAVLLAMWTLATSGCNCGASANRDGGDSEGGQDAGSSGVDAGGAAHCPSGATAGVWTWVSGASTADAPGVYGVLGAPAAGNVPGARGWSAAWRGVDGAMWLFGGQSTVGLMNDLWRFDGSRWTWVSGSDSANQPGVYGTLGIPGPGNVPGARRQAVAWAEPDGGLWLFGGQSSLGYMNDLWRLEGSQWTWVAGASTANDPGNWGALGVAAASNLPPARTAAVGWVSADGHLWLFGGEGATHFADLWEFDGRWWAWRGGPMGPGGSGETGERGVAGAGNNPPDVRDAVAWSDAQGAHWLFGGSSYACGRNLNEVWRLEGTLWAWLGGDCSSAPAAWGEQGLPSDAGTPGARIGAVAWGDTCGNGWLFGGADAFDGIYADLWQFDGVRWTWVSGPATYGATEARYGEKGVPDAGNLPGGRSGASAWVDGNGDVWIFGGWGYDSASTYGPLNDLWRYHP